MNISLAWLKDFIDIHHTAEELDELLTMSGLEVEAVEKYETVKGSLEGLIIGQVLTCTKHPDADRLSVTTVDVGENESLQIVCGAPNVAQGQKVVVAKVGATLYPVEGEPFKIKKSKIRGIESNGMICAEDEIGLGKSHEGIIVLDTDLPNGTPATRYFGTETDYVLSIGLTPNRVDAASHYGTARQLRALLNRPLKYQPTYDQLPTQEPCPIAIQIDDTQACKRYAGVYLENIKVAPSPMWLQHRLKSIGLQPINNVVDITNYVLHSAGQPLHAFDASKIAGKKVIIRKGYQATEFITLDGQKRKLTPSDLMIASAEEPMCIAGVFGGLTSGVSEQTTTVFLESAYFAPETVRATSQHHALKTDASFRFERGTDINMVLPALQMAIGLLQEIAGATIVGGVTDLYPTPIQPAVVRLRYRQINRLVGVEIPKERIIEILHLLEMNILQENLEELTISVPTYKVDVTREADIIEDILRIYGYNNVPTAKHIAATYLADAPPIDKHVVRLQLSEMLAGAGMSEIITNSLTNPDYTALCQAISSENDVVILNKLSHELGVMRQTLLFTGLEVLDYNINRKQTDLKLYEFGKTYRKENDQYGEREILGLFLTGNRHAETWQQPTQKSNFHTLLGILHKILAKLNANQYTSLPSALAFFSYGLTLTTQNKTIAEIGLVKPSLAKTLGIKQDVFYAEVDWLALLNQLKTRYPYEEISKFPEVRRDLSLVIDKNISFERIKEVAFQVERKLLRQINCFDVYEGTSLGEGKKAYSISFVLQDDEKTLTDTQIDKTMQRLMETYEKQLGAFIRK